MNISIQPPSLITTRLHQVMLPIWKRRRNTVETRLLLHTYIHMEHRALHAGLHVIAISENWRVNGMVLFASM